MGKARRPEPVKLIASLLAGKPALLDEAKTTLAHIYGPIDFESDLLPFDHTEYYTPEFGPGLQRKIVAFEQLISPADLPAVKHQTNKLEWALAAGEQRSVNIDPGYVSLGKLVLASSKDHAHRLYLGHGIYGEVTLTYQRGHFRSWPWTYPDYGSERYCSIFGELRERYKAQLTERRETGVQREREPDTTLR